MTKALNFDRHEGTVKPLSFDTDEEVRIRKVLTTKGYRPRDRETIMRHYQLILNIKQDFGI